MQGKYGGVPRKVREKAVETPEVVSAEPERTEKKVSEPHVLKASDRRISNMFGL